MTHRATCVSNTMETCAVVAVCHKPLSAVCIFLISHTSCSSQLRMSVMRNINYASTAFSLTYGELE